MELFFFAGKIRRDKPWAKGVFYGIVYKRSSYNNQRGGCMKSGEFSEMYGRLDAEIEDILQKSEAQQLELELLNIYQRVIVALQDEGFSYFRRHKLDLRHIVRAWDCVLKEVGVPQTKDVLLGVVLATAYECIKKEEIE
jgi:hypothetical protein